MLRPSVHLAILFTGILVVIKHTIIFPRDTLYRPEGLKAVEGRKVDPSRDVVRTNHGRLF
jgi:hypothetical protein